MRDKESRIYDILNAIKNNLYSLQAQLHFAQNEVQNVSIDIATAVRRVLTIQPLFNESNKFVYKTKQLRLKTKNLDKEY